MTPFQWIVASAFIIAIVIECLLAFYRLTRKRLTLVRSAVWIIGLALILQPNLLQSTAMRLHIGRGADFLLYIMALSFPVAGFYFLHALEKQRQQMTRLVRELAQRDPVHVPHSSPASHD